MGWHSCEWVKIERTNDRRFRVTWKHADETSEDVAVFDTLVEAFARAAREMESLSM